MKWYRLAAEQGLAFAQKNLGLMYAMGQGVPQDYKAAYAWFSVAAANGDEDAAKDRDVVAKELATTQLEQGQALANEYFEKYQPKP